MIDRSERVRLFVNEEILLHLDIALSADQAKYLFKVMRLNVGQFVTIIDGKTGEYLAKIIQKSIRTGKIRVEIKKSDVDKPLDLWLLFSPLRKNRTEWVIEKATELGVRRIVPVITSRTSVSSIRMERLKSIMIEALEQCGGTFLPELTEPITLANCLNSWPSDRQLIFCDESLSKKDRSNSFPAIHKNKVAGILIGPEGGFSEAEGCLIKQKKSVVSISLGPRILRADTAAVSAISIWQNIHFSV
tara:strand:+ start:357 stop:1094 length:738 start_codon:yes stop_codon:yes gene_type:complete